jgi:hypothetical protein
MSEPENVPCLFVGSRKIVELAFEIADEAARCDIESNCLGGPRGKWWDLGTGGDASWYVLRAARYLEQRGKLRHHPKQRNLVQVIEGEKS